MADSPASDSRADWFTTPMKGRIPNLANPSPLVLALRDKAQCDKLGFVLPRDRPEEFSIRVDELVFLDFPLGALERLLKGFCGRAVEMGYDWCVEKCDVETVRTFKFRKRMAKADGNALVRQQHCICAEPLPEFVFCPTCNPEMFRISEQDRIRYAEIERQLG